MKVVLFCGGFGMRMREYSESVPKPMVPIGYRPILWHVMKYYAHYGHKDFILCLGYKADVIKNYFRTYDECVSNDFVLSGGGKLGVRHQTHLQLQENTPLSSLWQTMVDKMGVSVRGQFQDSPGVIGELLG